MLREPADPSSSPPKDFAATYLSSVEAVSAKSSYLIRYLTLHASLSRSEDFAGPCFSFVLPLSSLPARILLDLAFPIWKTVKANASYYMYYSVLCFNMILRMLAWDCSTLMKRSLRVGLQRDFCGIWWRSFGKGFVHDFDRELILQ